MSLNLLSHKSENPGDLETYLEAISLNGPEKSGLLQHICSKGKGNFAEIGTGGDPLAHMLEGIEQKNGKDADIQIFACDIDPMVLEHLFDKHPAVKAFSTGDAGLRIKAKVLNVADMDFPDNYLDGINLSAVMHEVHSYAGTGSFEKTISEVTRTLREDGIMVYRDPEQVHNPERVVDMHLKTRGLRAFTNLFLWKFLDREHTLKKNDQGEIFKPNQYDLENIKITLTLKNGESANLSYHEFIDLYTKDIDFSSIITLTAPKGLCNEIKRHYITFLNDSNPLAFIKMLYHEGKYQVFIFSEKANSVYQKFCQAERIKNPNQLSHEERELLLDDMNAFQSFLENGFPIVLDSDNLTKLKTFLEMKGFMYDRIVTKSSSYSNVFLIDSKIYNFFHEELTHLGILNDKVKPLAKNLVNVIRWLKHEGEEYYYYRSPDRMLSDTLIHSVSKGIDKRGNQKTFVLCPISADLSYFVPRSKYEEVLERDYSLKQNGESIPNMKEGKRIIHFAKMTLEKALPILLEIIETNPEYTSLTTTVKEELLPLIFKTIDSGLSKIQEIQQAQYDDLG